MSTGIGGHYYSLLTLVNNLQVPYIVRVTGNMLPRAFGDRTDVKLYAYDKSSLKEAGEDIRRHQIKIIHAYDLDSALYGMKLSRRFNLPLVVTKAGGGPYGRLTPRLRNLVVFHKADYDRFDTKSIWRPKRLRLIPHRGVKPKDVSALRPNPFANSPSQALKVLRISRIGPDYVDSIKQAAALGNELSRLGIETSVSVVGQLEPSIDGASIVRQLRSLNPSVEVFTDDAYTIRASELIPYADVIVGTGRSCIEGMSYGKAVFFPVKGSTLPCLLTETSYGEASAENFSPRVRASESVVPSASIAEYVSSYQRGEAQDHGYFAYATFEKDYEIRTGVQKLMPLYEDVLASRDAYTLPEHLYAMAYLGRRKDMIAKIAHGRAQLRAAQSAPD